MIFNLLQLNLEKGRFLNDVIQFIKVNNFDIINFQEISGGEFSYEFRNCLKILQQNLSLYDNFFGRNTNVVNKPESYFGNMTLVKKELKAKVKEQIWLKPYKAITDINDYAAHPKSALALLLEISSTKIMVINTHLAWGPTPKDEEYKLTQANILYNYLCNSNLPFIMSGDFNVEPSTKIVKKFNSLATNLIEKYGITNTLNPSTHRAKHLFPTGVAADYIFVTSDIKVKNFSVIDDINLSDHYGLRVTCEV